MALIFNKGKKVKGCYERLGLLLLGGIATIIVLNRPATPALEELGKRKITFDINDDGVVVVLDIANTGTDSLADYMISNAILEPPCQCQYGLTKCKCLNKHGQPWLFHAFNTTGFVCGEHADFTTLTNCPIDYWFRTSGRDSRPSRQYLLVTIIRDPLTRYVSQWRSLTQEDTFFRNEPRLFRNQSVELQKKGVACYVGKKLFALSLQEFLSCSQNGATNLQTRMLANMTFVDSLGLTGKVYQESMLNSAKRTLEMLPFFGLFDRPIDSFRLLESTLGLQFKQPPVLEDSAVQGVFPLPVPLQQQILQVNNLDLKLYQHARVIFQERVKAMRFSGPTSGNIGSKSLGDNYKIIYRPDIFEKGEARSEPDITFDGHLNDIVRVEERTYMNNDVDDDSEDEYHTNKKRDVYYQKDAYLETNNENDEKDININGNFQINNVQSVMKGKEEIAPNVPDFSGSRVELENESIDYKPDVEDVSVFLSRLDRIKQQQKETNFIDSQNPLLPQTQQQLPQTIQSLYQLQQKTSQPQHQRMQRQAERIPDVASNIEQNNAYEANKPLQQAFRFLGSENLPNRGSALSQRETKLYQPYILTDRINVLPQKRGSSLHDKSVKRMFH